MNYLIEFLCIVMGPSENLFNEVHDCTLTYRVEFISESGNDQHIFMVLKKGSTLKGGDTRYL